MTKTNKSTKSTIKTVEENKETTFKIEKSTKEKTICYLASKANHIIEIQSNGQTTFIQPFGKIKVIKEQIKINPADARNLTFIKA